MVEEAHGLFEVVTTSRPYYKEPKRLGPVNRLNREMESVPVPRSVAASWTGAIARLAESKS